MQRWPMKTKNNKFTVVSKTVFQTVLKGCVAHVCSCIKQPRLLHLEANTPEGICIRKELLLRCINCRVVKVKMKVPCLSVVLYE